MKKIWILLRDLTETGGGERVCIQLANAWCDHYAVHIWSFHHGNGEPMAPLDSRVEVSCLSKGFQRAANPFRKVWNKTVYRLLQSISIHRLVCENRPDIVFCNDGTFMPLFKSPHSKYVRLWHLRFPSRKKSSLRRYDALVVLSGEELEKWRCTNHNVRVIPNFLPQLPELSGGERNKTVLSVGRMDCSDEKGFMRLLDIWAELQHCSPHPDWKLRLVGDGPFRPLLEERVNSLGISDTVEIGRFTSDIGAEYSAASVYAMASHREGFPMVLLESAAWGLPAVAYRVHTGPGEIISEGETGFLAADGQRSLFVSRLLSLMEDPDMRQRMGEAARNRVGLEYSQQHVMRMWAELFEDILKN